MAVTTQQLLNQAKFYLRLTAKTKDHELDLCYRATMHLSYMAAYQSALAYARRHGLVVRNGENHEKLWTYLQVSMNDTTSGDIGQQIRLTRNDAEYGIGMTFKDQDVRRHLTRAEHICTQYP